MKKARSNRLSKIARKQKREEIRRSLLAGITELTDHFNQQSVRFKAITWRSADKLSKKIARKMKIDKRSMQQLNSMAEAGNKPALEGLPS